MSKIETNGFLSKETENGINQITENYKDAFEFYKELNRISMLFLNRIKLDWKDIYRLVANTLILRIVENFQAIYLMLERGMLVPSKVLTRAKLETLFILAGLQKDPKLLKSYIDQNDEAHKRRLKAALQFRNEKLRESVKRINVEKLYIKRKAELKNREPTVLRPKEWAKAADLEDFYNLYYTMYSNSIHSNLSALEDHVDDKPKQIDISFGPSDRDLYELMQCNFYVIINSIRATAMINNDNISHDTDKMADEIRNLDSKYIMPIS